MHSQVDERPRFVRADEQRENGGAAYRVFRGLLELREGEHPATVAEVARIRAPRLYPLRSLASRRGERPARPEGVRARAEDERERLEDLLERGVPLRAE